MAGGAATPVSWTRRARRVRDRAPGCSAPPARLQRLAAGDEVDACSSCRGRSAELRRADTSPPSRSQAQVVRDQALRFVDQRRQLRHGPIAAHELLQQPPPHRVRRQAHERRRLPHSRRDHARPHAVDNTPARPFDQMQLMDNGRLCGPGSSTIDPRSWMRLPSVDARSEGAAVGEGARPGERRAGNAWCAAAVGEDDDPTDDDAAAAPSRGGRPRRRSTPCGGAHPPVDHQLDAIGHAGRTGEATSRIQRADDGVIRRMPQRDSSWAPGSGLSGKWTRRTSTTSSPT